MGTWKYRRDARGKITRIGDDALNRPRRKTCWKMVAGQERVGGNLVDDLVTVDNTISVYDIAGIRGAINANLSGLESTDPNKKLRIPGADRVLLTPVAVALVKDVVAVDSGFDALVDGHHEVLPGHVG